MSLVNEALKYLKEKQVIIVTDLDSDGYLQEIAGTLVGGDEGCLVIQQVEGESPTLINSVHIAWIYEEAGEEELDQEELDQEV